MKNGIRPTLLARANGHPTVSDNRHQHDTRWFFRKAMKNTSGQLSTPPGKSIIARPQLP